MFLSHLNIFLSKVNILFDLPFVFLLYYGNFHKFSHRIRLILSKFLAASGVWWLFEKFQVKISNLSFNKTVDLEEKGRKFFPNNKNTLLVV